MKVSVRTDYPGLPLGMPFTLRLLVDLTDASVYGGGCMVRFSPIPDRVRVTQLSRFVITRSGQIVVPVEPHETGRQVILELRVPPQLDGENILLGTVEVVPCRTVTGNGEAEAIPVVVQLIPVRDFAAVPQDQEVAAATTLQVIAVVREHACSLLQQNRRVQAVSWLKVKVAALDALGQTDPQVVVAIDGLRVLAGDVLKERRH